MGDVLGIIIFLSVIAFSLLQRMSKGSGGADTGKTIEERLQEAIERSMERARKQSGGQDSPRPPTVPLPGGRPSYKPLPQPPVVKTTPSPPLPPPVMRAPRPVAPSTFRPRQAIRESLTNQPSKPAEQKPVDGALASDSGQIFQTTGRRPIDTGGQRRESTGTKSKLGREKRAIDIHHIGGKRKRRFTREQLQELIIFSELMERPRILRKHPMYRRISDI